MRMSAGLVLVVMIVFAGPSLAMDGSFRYSVRTGADSSESVLSIEKGEGGRTTVRFEDEDGYSLSHLDDAYNTMRWELNEPEEKTAVIAERDGRYVMVKGTMKGEPVDERVDLGDDPWRQETAVGLIPFVKSDKTEMEFSVLRPFDFKRFKMRAIKQGIKTIEIHDDQVTALEIKVTLRGLMSRLWSSRYWYRQSDFTYLKYIGVNGPPGTPETVVELLGSTE
ncbi:hypothetical protein ACFLT7_05650 [candidate division KSB1 bacterium]